MTPTAGSDFSRYVIPADTNPAGICCVCVPVPDDVEWRAQFLGAIWRLSLQTHYERDAAHSAKIVAARWREVWTEVQTMAGCCRGSITDITVNTQINVTVQNFLFELNQLYIAAGLSIDVAWPLTPDDFDSDPGDVGPEVDQRTRALCIAVESWVNETFNRALSWLSSQTEEVAVVVAAGLALPSVPTYVVIGGFIGAGIVAGEVIQELASDAYRAYITCGMYTALLGQDSNSPAAFFASLDSLPARPPPPETIFQDIARDLIETWTRSQLNNLENYLGFIQSLNVAFTIADTLDDVDCACLGFVHTFDFIVENDAWTDRVDENRPYGIYTVGVGWVSEWGGPSEGLELDERLYIKRAGWPARVITEVQVWVTTTGVQGSFSRLSGVQIELADVTQDFFQEIFDVPEVYIDTLNTNLNADGVETFMAGDASADNSQFVITKIVVKGLGSDPF